MKIKAVMIAKHGGPEVLSVEDATLAAPGPGEVQIEHKAIGLNYIDTYFRTGLYPAPSMPFTPGNEGSGVVLAVGKGVEGFKKGDRVAYVGTLGAYTSARNIGADKLVKLPAKISFDAGAAMMLKGLTAEYLLFSHLQGEEGPYDSGTCRRGWHRPYPVPMGEIARCNRDRHGRGRPKRASSPSRMAPHHIIDYSKEDFAARVKEITKGAMCDVVYDGVGKATFPASLDCL